MTYHENARTTVHQHKRIRHGRAPYRVQAQTLGVGVATVAKWRWRTDVTDCFSRPHRSQKAVPSEAAPLLGWLRKDLLLDLDMVWLALRQTVFPQLSRLAVHRSMGLFDSATISTSSVHSRPCREGGLNFKGSRIPMPA